MGQHKQIQWFPGHMAKTRRLIKENLSLVDLVVELLNKCDAADPDWNNRWVQWFASQGIEALCTDCRSGKGLKIFGSAVRSQLAPLLERQAAKGMVGRPLRIMIVGIPNVGKSSLINLLQSDIQMETGSISKKIARGKHTTRHSELITIDDNSYIMDTPGFSSLYVNEFEKEELKYFQDNYRVSNLCHNDDKIVVRLVTDNPPENHKITIANPTIEDLYLYIFEQGM